MDATTCALIVLASWLLGLVIGMLALLCSKGRPRRK